MISPLITHRRLQNGLDMPVSSYIHIPLAYCIYHALITVRSRGIGLLVQSPNTKPTITHLSEVLLHDFFG